MKTRAQAALVIQQVLDQGQSLSAVLPAAQEKVAPRDRALLQELCYGTLRWLPRLDAAVNEMMDKPLKNKSRIFHYLILVGLYQLIYTRIPAHAAVAETVNADPAMQGRLKVVFLRETDASSLGKAMSDTMSDNLPREQLLVPAERFHATDLAGAWSARRRSMSSNSGWSVPRRAFSSMSAW